ncbi:hypothetical protein [Parapedobacter sp. 10938]|uniref:hypothetical protein n=1 Tax=Parapedobacter flavus TaxID=3110225 RepID=UPI002DBDD028|nr:hypothetical protein [Parapedobacter sp. 10938]MEC3879824.1 hypothetical protein [Parapedobacter sp. 10938]
MKNPKKGRFLIVIVVALAILGWQLLTTFGGTGGVSDKEKAALKADGIKCTATLAAIERTGTIVNNIHQYAFSFTIQPGSGQSFSYQEKKLIDPIYMSSIKIGMVIPAYASHDKEIVWVVWEDVGVNDAF